MKNTEFSNPWKNIGLRLIFKKKKKKKVGTFSIRNKKILLFLEKD